MFPIKPFSEVLKNRMIYVDGSCNTTLKDEVKIYERPETKPEAEEQWACG
jgi:hypothetical protein